MNFIIQWDLVLNKFGTYKLWFYSHFYSLDFYCNTATDETLAGNGDLIFHRQLSAPHKLGYLEDGGRDPVHHQGKYFTRNLREKWVWTTENIVNATCHIYYVQGNPDLHLHGISISAASSLFTWPSNSSPGLSRG